MRRPSVLIVGLRLTAILAVLIFVPLIWRFMSGLPWYLDVAIAVASALAFAYRFEREPSP